MNKKVRFTIYFVAFIFLFVVSYSYIFSLFDETFPVIAISDGDTITILKDKEKVKVRLAEIDCPEKKQPFGPTAKLVLTNKIDHKNVKVVYSKRDGYGRIIGKVYLNGRYINKEMIQEGLAWHYTEYSKSDELELAQNIAKKNKIGLWKDKNPTPPWEYRKNSK